MALFTKAEVSSLRDLFDVYAGLNIAGKPRLGLYELYALLPQFGPELPIERVTDLVYRYDSDSLGFVEFEDFLEVVQAVLLDGKTQQAELLEALKAASGAGRGEMPRIDAHSLRQVLMSDGSGVTYAEFAVLLDDAFPLASAGTDAARLTPWEMAEILGKGRHPVVESFWKRESPLHTSLGKSKRDVAAASAVAAIVNSISRDHHTSLDGITPLLEHTETRVASEFVHVNVRIFEILDVDALARTRPLPDGAGIDFEALSLFVMVRVSDWDGVAGVCKQTTTLVRDLYPEWHQDLELKIPLPSDRMGDIQTWSQHVFLHFDVFDAISHTGEPHAEWVAAAAIPLALVLENADRTLHLSMALMSPGGPIAPNHACYKIPTRDRTMVPSRSRSRLGRAMSPSTARAKSPALESYDSFYATKDLVRSSDDLRAKAARLKASRQSHARRRVLSGSDVDGPLVLEKAMATAREAVTGESSRVCEPKLIAAITVFTGVDEGGGSGGGGGGGAGGSRGGAEHPFGPSETRSLAHHFVPPDILALAQYPKRMEEDLRAGFEVNSEPVPDGSRIALSRKAQLDSLMAGTLEDPLDSDDEEADDTGGYLRHGAGPDAAVANSLWDHFLATLNTVTKIAPRRAFQLLALDEYNRFRWLPSFVRPFASIAAGQSEAQLASMVAAFSLDVFEHDIPFGDAVSQREQTLSPAVVMARKRGSELELAILLACLLIGAGQDAYVVVGTRVTGVLAYWVVTHTPLPYRRRRKKPRSESTDSRRRSGGRSVASRRRSIVDGTGTVVELADSNAPALSSRRRQSVDAAAMLEIVQKQGRIGSHAGGMSDDDLTTLYARAQAQQHKGRRRNSIGVTTLENNAVPFVGASRRRENSDGGMEKQESEDATLALAGLGVTSGLLRLPTPRGVRGIRHASLSGNTFAYIAMAMGTYNANQDGSYSYYSIQESEGSSDDSSGGISGGSSGSSDSNVSGGRSRSRRRRRRRRRRDEGGGTSDSRSRGRLSRNPSFGSAAQALMTMTRSNSQRSIDEALRSAEWAGGGYQVAPLNRYSTVARMHNPHLAFEPDKFAKARRARVRPISVVHWDPSTGKAYADCQNAAFPFATVGVVFNGTNGWINVAAQDSVERLIWDLRVATAWRPFFSERLLAKHGPLVPWFSEPTVAVDPVLDRAAERAISQSMTDQLAAYIRVHRGADTDLCPAVSKALAKTLAFIDMVERAGGKPGIQATMDAAWPTIQAAIPDGAFLHARLYKFKNTTVEAIADQLVYTGILDAASPGLLYTLALRLVSMPLRLEHIWVWVGYLEWGVAHCE